MKEYDRFLASILPSKVYAIINDSKKEKSGDATDAVFRLFDSNEKRYLNCHSFVVSALNFGQTILPFRTEIYQKESEVSKLDLAENMIDGILKIIKPLFLFDSWYCCPQIVNKIVDSNCKFISRLKMNRTVKIDGFWKSLEECRGLVKSWQFREMKIRGRIFYACSSILEVYGLGKFNVVFVKKKRHGQDMIFL